MYDTIALIITACGASLVVTVGNIISQALARRAERKKGKAIDVEAAIARIEKQMKGIMEAQQLSMLDRIKYLGLKYIKAGEVDFDDRRILRQMHDVYHNKLGGNGDLDVIMQQVDTLPLSETHKKGENKK